MLTGEDSPVDGKDTLGEPLWVECARVQLADRRVENKTQVPVLGIVQPQDRDKALASPDVSGVASPGPVARGWGVCLVISDIKSALSPCF